MSSLSTLESIFAAALDRRSEQDRVAYLDDACRDNPEMRGHVDRLLNAQARAGNFLQNSGPGLSGTLDQQPREQPGTIIGPYRLLQQIGEGGMGTVYMAEQTHPVQRKVALKLIKAGMDSRQVSARFEAERQALALMDHPNIAKVFDAGMTDAGQLYFVMELVKGVPITNYCDQHHLSPRERLELFVPVCHAIQHAHQKGIIHRDIKPSNVMVCVYDGKPMAKVIDFGVAKATGSKLTERTMYTEFGAIVGTFEFLSVAFSPDDKTVAAGGTESVKWWTRGSDGWREKATLTGHGFGPPVAFSADGKLLAAGGQDLKVYDVATGKERATLQGHQGRVDSVAFSPHGTTMASGSEDRTVKLWEVLTGNGRTLGAHLASVYCVAFSPDGNTLASGSVDRTISIWETAPNLATPVLQHSGAVRVVAFTPDGKTLVSAGEYPTQIWDLATEKAFTLRGQTGEMNFMALAPDGSALAAPAPEKTVKLWNLATGQTRGTFQAKTEVSGVAFSPDGKTLATWRSWRGDPSVSLWDVATQQLRATLPGGGNDSMISLVFSPDNKTLVAGGQNNSLIVWDVATGQQKLHVGLDRGSSATWSVAFSPDGTTLATGGGHGTARLWHVDGWELQASLKGHTGIVRTLAFSPDGGTLATGSDDRTVKLWDVATGQERITLKGHTNVVSYLAFAPDGKILATGSQDGTVSLWRAATNPEASAVKTELDPDEPASPVEQNDAGDRLAIFGHPAQAENAYRRALERLTKLAAAFPNVPEYREELARGEFSLSLLPSSSRRPADAKESRRQALERHQALPGDYRWKLANDRNDLAWFLASTPDANVRDAERAVELAKVAVELSPKNASFWNTLGVAHYRATDAKAAITALNKSMDLNKGGAAIDWFFLAMAHWQLGGKQEAQKWYKKGVLWMDEYKPADAEMRRVRAEAEKVLELNK